MSSWGACWFNEKENKQVPRRDIEQLLVFGEKKDGYLHLEC